MKSISISNSGWSIDDFHFCFYLAPSFLNFLQGRNAFTLIASDARPKARPQPEAPMRAPPLRGVRELRDRMRAGGRLYDYSTHMQPVSGIAGIIGVRTRALDVGLILRNIMEDNL